MLSRPEKFNVGPRESSRTTEAAGATLGTNYNAIWRFGVHGNCARFRGPLAEALKQSALTDLENSNTQTLPPKEGLCKPCTGA